MRGINRVGEIHDFNGEKVKIIERHKSSNNALYSAQFESGFIVTTTYDAIKKGKIKDGYSPSLFGVGYLGCLKRKGYERQYEVWANMIARCYNEKNPTYEWYGKKGMTVCERWKCFENFVADIRKIDGFDENLFNNGEIQLDKDIKQSLISDSEKVYSLETCTFVSQKENMQVRKYKLATKFIAIDPNGNKFESSNLREFCREHNLIQANAWKVLNKINTHTKGWKLYNIQEEVDNNG